jgi:hypothetical protein
MPSFGKERAMTSAQTSAGSWLEIVRGEFQETPGLHCTKTQYQRLWGLDVVACDAILEALINARFLKRTHNGTYARADGER